MFFVQNRPIFALFANLKIFQKLTTLALKSLGLTTVPVQVRSAAPEKGRFWRPFSLFFNHSHIKNACGVRDNKLSRLDK